MEIEERASVTAGRTFVVEERALLLESASSRIQRSCPGLILPFFLLITQRAHVILSEHVRASEGPAFVKENGAKDLLSEAKDLL